MIGLPTRERRIGARLREGVPGVRGADLHVGRVAADGPLVAGAQAELDAAAHWRGGAPAGPNGFCTATQVADAAVVA